MSTQQQNFQQSVNTQRRKKKQKYIQGKTEFKFLRSKTIFSNSYIYCLIISDHKSWKVALQHLFHIVNKYTK